MIEYYHYKLLKLQADRLKKNVYDYVRFRINWQTYVFTGEIPRQ